MTDDQHPLERLAGRGEPRGADAVMEAARQLERRHYPVVPLAAAAVFIVVVAAAVLLFVANDSRSSVRTAEPAADTGSPGLGPDGEPLDRSIAEDVPPNGENPPIGERQYAEGRRRWDGLYLADGFFAARYGGFEYSTELASNEMMMNYADDGTVHLFGYLKQETQEAGFGLRWTSDTPSAERIRRFSLIAPIESGTLTFSFPTKQYVSFLGLGVGRTSTSITLDEQYVLSITRPRSDTWTLEVTEGPALSNDAAEYLRRATLTMRVSPSTSTWRTVALDLSVAGDGGSFESRLELSAT